MSGFKWPIATHWSETPVRRVLRPIQEFTGNAASGGVVLLIATVAALAIANSPLADAYNALLGTYVSVAAGPFEIRETLLHWINDGLMAIFFFLVGLEIKRELRVGELSNLRAALLPIVAALGGAVLPAGIYIALNAGTPGMAGWGIPMATDIAFALGILALLGSRVPFALKILLTAIAIVDDLLAVLVIALFYSGGINFGALGIGFGLLAFLLMLNVLGIRSVLPYILTGLVIWVAFLESGVHATIAGVLVAWTIPGRNRINQQTFLDRAYSVLDHFKKSNLEPTIMLMDEVQQHAVTELKEVAEDVQAPLQRMEHALHKWVQFGIMPIFALANAGVAFSLDALAGDTAMVGLGIMFGLVVGKVVGITGAAWLAVRGGWTVLPDQVYWRHIVGMASLGGVGFTMSLFIASLAFEDAALIETAKLAILFASLIAASLGVLLLRRTTPAGAQGVE